ncbi:hypothetical protein [uncultured Bradyrhizobium sp.]|jgi:hypothetical protein|uniref:hypothetical protein n=1 Tax=uncultured Bradyrhizobium sp. TaxID=199684 RepID=UPI002610E5DE|nr:hypothetical protein [uncultured Bradyrhizobium sp.]
MTSKTFVSFLTFPPRRRLAATTIMYGLSLAVRFTSATGEEVEIPPQSLHPAMSIISNDDTHLSYAGWGGPNAIEPAFFRRRSAGSTSSCPSP